MSKFEKKIGSSINNNCNISNSMLKQGLNFLNKKKKEGFVEGMDARPEWTGTYEEPKMDQSFFSLYSPSAFNSDPHERGYQTKVNERLRDLRGKFENSLEGSGAIKPTTQKALEEYQYAAEKYAQHFAGLTWKLQKCRKKCMERNLRGGAEECYRGCQLRFPKWANKSNTYGPTEGGDECNYFVNQDICNKVDYKVKAGISDGERKKLGQVGKLIGDGVNPSDDLTNTPITGCYECGGGVQGEKITRDVDGNYIKRSDAKVPSCGGDANCEKYWSKADNAWSNSAPETGDIPYTLSNTELNALATKGGNGIFNSEAPSMPGEIDVNAQKTLWDRFTDMNTKWNSLGTEIKNAKIIVDGPNKFNDKISVELDNDITSDVPGVFTSMSAKVKGLAKTRDQLATDKQRFKDVMLKQDSQYMKNGAFSVLAISLFIFAITKIKGI
tara:strand:+ start:382 stop:1704 length:1323 start_codon:yes stop_codon:yes gene_type:complete